MAYKIILPLICFIQCSILDFIGDKTKIEIDCRTIDGQRQYIKLFGIKAFNKKVRPYLSAKGSILLYGEVILSSNLLKQLFSQLSERARRLVAGMLYLSIKSKNAVPLKLILGLDLKTIKKGAKELINGWKLERKRDRIPGGGRKSKINHYENFIDILEAIADDHLEGDPMTEKRSVRKSLKYFKKKMGRLGIKVSLSTIRKYLRKQKISLKGNRKIISKTNPSERDKQISFINKKRKDAEKAGIPVISVDTKKKENIGKFKMPGRTWLKKFKHVFGYDFPSLGKGKMTPYGIYDLKHNKGYMYCGITPDTPRLAVEMIVRWWKEHGQFLYPDATELVILCDGGGSNGYRIRGWKYELFTKLAIPYNLKIRIHHYPTGCSKYNPIERKLFSFITINWAGEPLESVEKALAYINSTTTTTGLVVQGFLIEKKYPRGIKYSDQQMEEIKLRKSRILPKFNYTILPG